MSRRIEKINQLLKQEVSDLILKRIDFTNDIMATITRVDASSDLCQAKIKVSIIPFFKAEKILKVLNSQIPNLQGALNKRLKMRVVPKIQFELDKSEERINRIEQLIKKTKEE